MVTEKCLQSNQIRIRIELHNWKWKRKRMEMKMKMGMETKGKTKLNASYIGRKQTGQLFSWLQSRKSADKYFYIMYNTGRLLYGKHSKVSLGYL